MKSNESKPLSWERQTFLCWKYFKTKTWYWEILWDKVWIIRGLVFEAALSNFLFAAQTSNCFGCFATPPPPLIIILIVLNRPSSPLLFFVFDTVLLQIVPAPPLNSFVSAHSLINVFYWGLNCFVDITQSLQVEGEMVNLAAAFSAPQTVVALSSLVQERWKRTKYVLVGGQRGGLIFKPTGYHQGWWLDRRFRAMLQLSTCCALTLAGCPRWWLGCNYQNTWILSNSSSKDLSKSSS